MAAEIFKPSQFNRPGAEPAPEVETPEAAPLDIDELPLSEVQYGEELLGELTADEVVLFLAYYQANSEAQALDREIGGGLLMTLGQDIKSGKATAHENGYDLEKNIDPDLAQDAFRANALAAKAKADFFWAIGERFHSHDWMLGVRTKRRIVKAKRKY
jgi:hypothetical protein